MEDGGKSQFKFKVNTNLNNALVAILKMVDFKVRFNLKLARRQTFKMATCGNSNLMLD